MFRAFFATMPGNFARIFAPRYLVWHALFIVATYLLVVSGFDWWYFTQTRSPYLFELTLPAAIGGFFVPIIVPVLWYGWGSWRKNRKAMLAAATLAQAQGLGWLISSVYKAFTGRIQPEFLTYTNMTDISHQFNFGFWQHGIFWGWPSSHTAVAFAGAAALIGMYPKNKVLAVVAGLYALYIGIGISVSIHWFSDFVAGAILGALVGTVVARQLKKLA
ncbi:MAG: hypothetical protein JWL87_290 [Candidatus Adlerbacteria bacterium]|nr:hypothetical protein [Candidatus Adlerbacteria bacterium]